MLATSLSFGLGLSSGLSGRFTTIFLLPIAVPLTFQAGELKALVHDTPDTRNFLLVVVTLTLATYHTKCRDLHPAASFGHPGRGKPELSTG